MYKSDNLKQTDKETFTYTIDKNKDFKILQLTDLHLGFGFISRKKDKLALNAVTKIIHKAKPDMIVLTGDSIFPFLPKAGTLNNRKQAYKLMKFMDSFAIPYTLVFGNHDCEMGSTCNKEELAQIYKKGKYCIFTEGRKELTGVGNFFINLTDSDGNALLPLVMLDSNMYGEGGWFYSGFDRIHDDQEDWCMTRLNDLNKAVENGVIKWMFCGHDHLNTLSLIYKGIQMTYGMSIDYLGYKDIDKSYIQRGGTLITRKPDGRILVSMVPLGAVISTRVSGKKNEE